MAKKIQKSDISDADVFGALRESAAKALGQIQELDDTLRKMASDTAQKIKNIQFDSAKSINEFTKATKEANAVQKESVKVSQEEAKLKQQIIKIDQELEKLQQQQAKTERENIRNTQMLNREKEREAKALERAAKAAEAENNAYKKLVKETRDLKNESKRLGAEMLKLEKAGKINSQEYSKLASQYNRVTAAAKKGDQQLKKLDKTVGDNFRNVGNYRDAIKGLTGMLSNLGLAFGGAAIFRNVGETIIGFEQSMANLSAITGATGEDLKALEEAAISLGGKTTLSASQVAEGFKLIGSAKPELLQNQEALIGVTESAITLAEAAGIDLPDAASALTNTLNQFGASADSASQFVDILAAGSKFGAGDINFLNGAMEKAGTVANVAGLEFRETAAALEVIAKSGVPAEKAGTDFRNVLLNLQKEGIGFVDGQFEIRAALEQTRKMLSDIEDPAKRAEKATTLFGKQSVATGQFLMENIDLYDQLNDQLNEVGIAAEQQAINTDTLGGAIDRVKSAWEEYILRADEAGGFSDQLKDILDFLAKNLATILNTVLSVAKAYVTWKAVTITSAAANKVMAASLKDVAENATMGQKAMGAMKGAMKGVGNSFKKLGAALKANAFGLALLAIYKLIEAFDALNTEAEQMEEIQGRLNEISSEAALRSQEEKMELDLLVESIKDANSENGERDRLITQLNNKYGTTLQNIQDEDKFLQALAKTYEQINKQIDQKIRLDEARATFAFINQEIAKLEAENLKFQAGIEEAWGQNFATEFIQGFGDYENTRGFLKDQIAENDKVLKRLKKQQAAAKKDLKALMLEEIKTPPPPPTPETGDDDGDPGSGDDKRRKAKKKFNTELETQYSLQEELNKAAEAEYQLQLKIQNLNRLKQISDLDVLIEKEQELIDKQIQLGKEPDMANITKYLADRNALIIQGIEKNAEMQIQAEEEAIDDRFLKEFDRLTDQRDKLLAQEGITASAKAKINSNYDAEIRKAQEAWLTELEGFKAREAEIEADAQDKIKRAYEQNDRELQAIINRRAEIINATFDREAQEYRLKLLQSNMTREELEEDYMEFLIKQLEKRIAALKAAGADTLQEEIALAELKRKELEETNKEVEDEEKKSVERRIQIAQVLTDYFIEQSNKRIEQIDKEIQAAEKQADFLRDAAAQGNIDAKESLAEQQRIIDEANRRKEQEQRRQERIKMAFAAYEAYERNASDPNVQNPLAKTITDITLLKQFIASLPTFYEGIEDTGKHGEGVDGKGGFHAILHPNERVIPKAQNDLIGDLSNIELASLAQQYHAGKIIHSGEAAVQIGGPWQSAEVIAKLDQLNHTIQNKPEIGIELEEIIDGSMTILRKTQKNNSVIYNRYRIKN